MSTSSKIIVVLMLYGVTGFYPLAKKGNCQDATFNYTGAVQTYTVPACIYSLTVDVRGAEGAAAGGGDNSPGGQGGRVVATIPVTPGEVLNIYVGQMPTSNAAGWNGGGTGGNSPGGAHGGGGGGASDIRQNGTALSDRIVVGGGGGGGGFYSTSNYNGGHGGNLTAGGGQISSGGGGGGTQSNGGAGGNCCSAPGNPGSFGNGGDRHSNGQCGGGGGGGYYGGGSGASNNTFSYGFGGGGGSSYTISAATNVSHTQGFQSGHGRVSITEHPMVVDAGTDELICHGDSVQLNASGPSAVTHTWSPAAGLSNPNVADPWASPDSTTTYTVTVTDANGCTASDSVEVTVYPQPPANAGSSITICVGDSTQLQASGGVSYSWSPAFDLSDPNIANPWASPSDTTIYTVTVTDSDGCTATDSVTVNVTTNALVADAGPDTSICEGGAVQLMASGGTDYSWSPATGLSCTNCWDPIASPLTATQYFVTVSSGSCPTDTDTVEVAIYPPPSVDAGNDQTIMAGDSVQLNATGPPNGAYSWSPVVGLSDPTIANPWASPSDTTTYTVTVADSNGCTASDSVTVMVEPVEDCETNIDNHSFEADAIGTTLGSISAWNYRNGSSNWGGNSSNWSYTPSDFEVEIVGTHYFSSSQGVRFYLEGGDGCNPTRYFVQELYSDYKSTSADYITFWVRDVSYSTPSRYSFQYRAVIEDSTNREQINLFCTGELNCEGCPGGSCFDNSSGTAVGADSETWKRYTFQIPAAIDKSNMRVAIRHYQSAWSNGCANSTFYADNVCFSDANGNCLTPEPVTITTEPTVCDSYTSPSGNYVWTTSGTYMDTIPDTTETGCDKVFTIHLTVNNSSSNYIRPTACGSYASPSGNYTWNTTGLYMDTIPNSSGCDSVITVDLEVYNSSNAAISPTACNSYTSPSGNAVWTSGGTYMDTISNSAGCDSVITVDLTITEGATTAVTQDDEATLTADASAATYQWLDCGNNHAPVTGETGQSFTATQDGNYAVEVTQNSCTDTSECYSITGVDVETLVAATAPFQLYPNPNNGSFTLMWNEPAGKAKVTITNVLGQIVYEAHIAKTRSAHEITLDVPQGVFFARVQMGDATYVARVVVTE